ncbi:unnamed protein product [Caenorhabditis nigoni]
MDSDEPAPKRANLESGTVQTSPPPPPANIEDRVLSPRGIFEKNEKTAQLAKIEELEASNGKLEQAVAEKQKKLEDALGEKVRLMSQLDAQQTKFKEQEERMQKFSEQQESKLAEKNKEIEQVKMNTKEMENKLKDVQRQRSDERETFEDWQKTRVSELRDQNAQMVAYQQKLEAAATEIRTLKTTCTVVEASEAQTKQKLQIQVKKVDELTKKLVETEAERDDLQRKLHVFNAFKTSFDEIMVDANTYLSNASKRQNGE